MLVVSILEHSFQQNRLDVFCCFKPKSVIQAPRHLLKRIFEKHFTPFVLHEVSRPLIIFGFMTWLIGSVLVLPGVDIGLEQDMAMPKDSYLKTYFQVCLKRCYCFRSNFLLLKKIEGFRWDLTK